MTSSAPRPYLHRLAVFVARLGCSKTTYTHIHRYIDAYKGPIGVAMEEYKAKYAIHEACREGQGMSMSFLPARAPPALSLTKAQHPASTLSSPPIPSLPVSATQTIACPSTGPCRTTTCRLCSLWYRQSRLMPTLPTARAGRR